MTPYELALEEVGTYEWADGHNPKVVAYFADSHHPEVKNDETAWCAAFVGAMCERAGVKSTRALNARSYLKWGKPVLVGQAQPGDVVIFSRGNPQGWQGHVAFFHSQSNNYVKVLGGNQANQVNVKNYSKNRLLGIRRPPKSTNKAKVGSGVAAVAATGGLLALKWNEFWAWFSALFGG